MHPESRAARWLAVTASASPPTSQVTMEPLKIREAVMCETHAFILKDGKEKLFLESVDLITFEEDDINLVSIFGEQKTLKARLKLYDNTNQKIVFEPF
jgi:predicted RNA-binding protein